MAGKNMAIKVETRKKVKPIVDSILQDYFDSEKSFTINDILKETELTYDYSDSERSDISRGTVSSIVHRYMDRGIISISAEKKLGYVYQCDRSPLKVKDKSQVRHIKPAIQDLTKEKLENLDLSYSDLGEAVFSLLKDQSEKINRLEIALTDENLLAKEHRKEMKSFVARKDKTVQELNEKIEALRNCKGTFKLSEVAKIESSER